MDQNNEGTEVTKYKFDVVRSNAFKFQSAISILIAKLKTKRSKNRIF